MLENHMRIKLRCSSCGHVWHVLREEPETTASGEESVDDAENEDFDGVEEESANAEIMRAPHERTRLNSPRKKQFWDVFSHMRAQEKISSDSVRYKIAALVFICVISGLFLIDGFTTFVEPAEEAAWERKYGKYPFELLELKSSFSETSNESFVLKVGGKIRNISEIPLLAPQLRVDLLDENEGVLKTWIVDAPKDQFEAGMAFSFAHQFPLESAEKVRRLKMSFIPARVRRQE